MTLFSETIDDWDSWGKVFQSVEAFEPLICEIYGRHGLPFCGLGRLTPGTNAVFRVGDTVAKLYAPAEAGIVPDMAELGGLRHAEAVGVPAPRIIATGEIHDKYTFKYIIMEVVEGKEAGDVLASFSDNEKCRFAAQLRGITDKLNVPDNIHEIPDNIVPNVINNERWNGFPPSLKAEAISFAQNLGFDDFVYVHGDLTGENVLVDVDGNLRLIDFGDSHFAPNYYEWPPIVFELFRCDPILMREYFGDYSSEQFIETLARAVLLHDFGGGFVRDICAVTGAGASEVDGFEALKALIRKRLQGVMK